MTIFKSIKTEAYKLVFWQLGVIMVLAFLMYLIQGVRSGLSVLAGGLSYGLPNLFFVWRVFNYMGARSAKKFLIAFFSGEIAKLILSAVFFVMIVKFFSVSVLAMLIGFCAAIIAFWFISFYFVSHDQGVFL